MKSQAIILPVQRSVATRGIFVLFIALALLLAQTMIAQARESMADLAEQISPSVVNITTSTTIAAAAGNLPTLPDGSPFEDFFKNFRDPEQPDQNDRRRPRRRKEGSQGARPPGGGDGARKYHGWHQKRRPAHTPPTSARLRRLRLGAATRCHSDTDRGAARPAAMSPSKRNTTATEKEL